MVKVLRATPERRWSKRALLLVLSLITLFGSITRQRRRTRSGEAHSRSHRRRTAGRDHAEHDGEPTSPVR